MGDDGRDEEEAPDNTTMDDEGVQKDKSKKGTGHAAAHAASVDDTVDVEPRDPDSEPVDDTTAHHHNERDESSHDADDSPTRDEVSNDNPEGERVDS